MDTEELLKTSEEFISTEEFNSITSAMFYSALKDVNDDFNPYLVICCREKPGDNISFSLVHFDNFYKANRYHVMYQLGFGLSGQIHPIAVVLVNLAWMAIIDEPRPKMPISQMPNNKQVLVATGMTFDDRTCMISIELGGDFGAEEDKPIGIKPIGKVKFVECTEERRSPVSSDLLRNFYHGFLMPVAIKHGIVKEEDAPKAKDISIIMKKINMSDYNRSSGMSSSSSDGS